MKRNKPQFLCCIFLIGFVVLSFGSVAYAATETEGGTRPPMPITQENEVTDGKIPEEQSLQTGEMPEFPGNIDGDRPTGPTNTAVPEQGIMPEQPPVAETTKVQDSVSEEKETTTEQENSKNSSKSENAMQNPSQRPDPMGMERMGDLDTEELASGSFLEQYGMMLASLVILVAGFMFVRFYKQKNY